MAYVRSDGVVESKRSMLRVSIVSDVFWEIVNFLWLFISSLIDPKKPLPKRYNSSSLSGSGGNGGGGGKGGKPKGPNIHQIKPPTSGNCTAGGG